ncbi:chemotaxis response regulator protein-glutamate methylesterase [Bacillus methanolicus]|uniref:protein-glutamate methylesterase/protein-glutamine glutaminase n=1 Tax=Bacillus methanolicus TaxID=1471 RepID=UPI00200C2978|nr:chemotaxis response regulator protein-glutamate methylesterase [Bacillus methanolicus]UQD51724.1 chemotaxis response regulator protein-glutamate methylesterase [Bacillus methanolicus]
MEKIKVLVVDDSAFMRKLIQDFLSENPRISVIGIARNGEDAVKKVKELKPDVVTLDIEMPVLNGLEALKTIMQENPVPIIMLSSTTREGEENTVLALEYGAIDFVQKPSGAISLDLHKVKDELVRKVISASKANIKQVEKTSLIGTTETENHSKIEPQNPIIHSKVSFGKWNYQKKKLICIGTSTGGPRALQHVLTQLPRELPAPVLVVQHMPSGFTKSLADRLNALSYIHVKEAEDGELLKKGTAYIAPGGYHLKVKQVGTSLVVQLDKSSPYNGHRPSVDVMFESVSKIKDYLKIAVIMTGMGSDGAEGLIHLKSNGVVKAIAESQETSIVFGMPRAAIATRLVDEVQNVENIAETIMKYV